MRVIAVSAGGATRAVLARLGELRDVVVIDPDPERLTRIGTVRTSTAVEGYGSSRVILNRAGVANADAVIAATGDDAVTWGLPTRTRSRWRSRSSGS